MHDIFKEALENQIKPYYDDFQKKNLGVEVALTSNIHNYCPNSIYFAGKAKTSTTFLFEVYFTYNPNYAPLDTWQITVIRGEEFLKKALKGHKPKFVMNGVASLPTWQGMIEKILICVKNKEKGKYL